MIFCTEYGCIDGLNMAGDLYLLLRSLLIRLDTLK